MTHDERRTTNVNGYIGLHLNERLPLYLYLNQMLIAAANYKITRIVGKLKNTRLMAKAAYSSIINIIHYTLYIVHYRHYCYNAITDG